MQKYTDKLNDTCVSLACWLFKSLCRKNPLTHLLLSPGEISTRTILDREQQSSYQLAVLVQDGGSPSRSATGTAFITVLDENDNDPSFTHSLSGKSLVIQVTRHDQANRLTWIYV